jgi:hypothetical protein
MMLEQYAAVAEIAGFLAVIVTLAYLSIQIRANTIAMKSGARKTAVGLANSFASILGSSRECSSIFSRGLSEFDRLEDDEKVQFLNLFAMLIAQADAAHLNYELGIASLEDFDVSIKTQKRFLKTPGGTAYWKIYGAHRKGFESYINENVFGNTRKADPPNK